MLNFKNDEKVLVNLPASPGVYKFYSKDKSLLYVGKSINIKNRVRSHLKNETLNNRRVDIRAMIDRVQIIPTATDLGAMLLELDLIKTELPIYNRQSRRYKRLYVLRLQLGQHPVIAINEVDSEYSIHDDQVPGLFRSKTAAIHWLESVAKDNKLCPKRLGLVKSTGACFWSQIGHCGGVCKGFESIKEHDDRLRLALDNISIKVWPHSGPLTIASYESGINENFLINNWQLQGATIDTPHGTIALDGLLSRFDYDVYRVLAKSVLRYL